jgi:hypothetical protein
LKIDEIRLTKDAPFQSVEVMAFAPDARQYEYHVTLAPLAAGPQVEFPPSGLTEKKTGILLLESLVV